MPAYLSLDLGQRRTGVALSLSGLIVTPLTTLETNTPHLHKFLESLTPIVKEHEITHIVVGDPRNEDGTSNPQSEWVANAFSQVKRHLSTTIPWEITYSTVDEYHSTIDGAELFPGADKDSAAAAIILQDFPESQE